MKIICISASNTKSKGAESTSTKICDYIKNVILEEYKDSFTAETVALSEYDIKNCILCGACSKTGQCVYDPEFNRFAQQLSGADGIFLIIPHYSPIPSKLLMIFEKINEIIYAEWINNPEYISPLTNKPVALIGHGGMVENSDTLRHYHDHLLGPVANTLRSLSYRIVKYDDNYEYGAVFGLKDDTCLQTTESSVFPDIVQDWPKIESRIRPFITRLIQELKPSIK